MIDKQEPWRNDVVYQDMKVFGWLGEHGTNTSKVLSYSCCFSVGCKTCGLKVMDRLP